MARPGPSNRRRDFDEPLFPGIPGSPRRDTPNPVDEINNAFGLDDSEEDTEAGRALEEFLEERGGVLTPRNARRVGAFSSLTPTTASRMDLTDGISTSAPGTYQPGRYGANDPAPEPQSGLEVGRGNTGGIGRLQTILTGAGAQRRSRQARQAGAGNADTIVPAQQEVVRNNSNTDRARQSPPGYFNNRDAFRNNIPEYNFTARGRFARATVTGRFNRRSIL